jgi:hypothetical protein
MPVLKQTFFVADDGEEFIFEDLAIRHNLRLRGSAKLAAFLGEVPGMSEAVECYGSDTVDDIVAMLSDWLFTSPASTTLIEIVRCQKKSAAKAGANPGKLKVKP